MADEWRLSTDEFEYHDSETPDIAELVVWLLGSYFWREVDGGAFYWSEVSANLFRETEIAQLADSVHDQYVLWFDVSVCYFAFVQIVQCLEYLQCDLLDERYEAIVLHGVILNRRVVRAANDII